MVCNFLFIYTYLVEKMFKFSTLEVVYGVKLNQISILGRGMFRLKMLQYFKNNLKNTQEV